MVTTASEPVVTNFAGIERALRVNCAPQPTANAIMIPLDAAQVEAILSRPGQPATTIVAINVEPGLNTPYGCRSCSDECETRERAGTACSCKGKEVGDSYRFRSESSKVRDY